MAKRKTRSLNQPVSQQMIDFGAVAHHNHVETANDSAVTGGLSISQSFMYDVTKLKQSEHNTVFDEFKTDNYWTQLRADITSVGSILEPLIVTKDDIVVSGHSRLTIACELLREGDTRFEKVPVRRIETGVSDAELKRRMLLMNLLRFEIDPTRRTLLNAQAFPEYYSSNHVGRQKKESAPTATAPGIAAATNRSVASIRREKQILKRAEKRAREAGRSEPTQEDVSAATVDFNAPRRVGTRKMIPKNEHNEVISLLRSQFDIHIEQARNVSIANAIRALWNDVEYVLSQ